MGHQRSKFVKIMIKSRQSSSDFKFYPSEFEVKMSENFRNKVNLIKNTQIEDLSFRNSSKLFERSLRGHI